MDELADRPVLAIDLGGTQIRAALVTTDALPIVTERLTDPAFRGGSHRPHPAATNEQGALRP